MKQTNNQTSIDDRLNYERLVIMLRKLRWMELKNPELMNKKEEVIASIKAYGKENDIDFEKISEEELLIINTSEKLAEDEQLFFAKRKEEIKKKLKKLGLTQKDLAKILGHKSVTHMSELMNGISPFTNNDLKLIHHVLRINYKILINPTITIAEKERITSVLLRRVRKTK